MWTCQVIVKLQMSDTDKSSGSFVEKNSKLKLFCHLLLPRSGMSCKVANLPEQVDPHGKPVLAQKTFRTLQYSSIVYNVKFYCHSFSQPNGCEKTLFTIAPTLKCICVCVCRQHSRMRKGQPLEGTMRGCQGEERGEARLMKYECVY